MIFSNIKSKLRLGIIKYAGFTLAELLIVLGVIGIIAEMTIPTLVRDFQNQVLKSQFKSTYANLSSALLQVKSNLGDYPQCNYGDYSGNAECPAFFTELAKTLKVTKTCAGSAYANGCIPNYNDYNGGGGCAGFNQNYIANLNYAYVLSDGTIIEPYAQSSMPYIMVDLNGQSPPNKWGFDVFTFAFSKTETYMRLLAGQCFTPESGGKTTATMQADSFK